MKKDYNVKVSYCVHKDMMESGLSRRWSLTISFYACK